MNDSMSHQLFWDINMHFNLKIFLEITRRQRYFAERQMTLKFSD